MTNATLVELITFPCSPSDMSGYASGTRRRANSGDLRLKVWLSWRIFRPPAFSKVANDSFRLLRLYKNAGAPWSRPDVRFKVDIDITVTGHLALKTYGLGSQRRGGCDTVLRPFRSIPRLVMCRSQIGTYLSVGLIFPRRSLRTQFCR